MPPHVVVPHVHFTIMIGELDLNQRMAVTHAVAGALQEMDPDSAVRTAWVFTTDKCPTDDDWIIREADIRSFVKAQLGRLDSVTIKYDIDTQNLLGYSYKYIDGMIVCCRGYQVLENGNPKEINVPGVGKVPLLIFFEAAAPLT